MADDQSLIIISNAPALNNEQHREYMQQMKEFVQNEMIPDADYGIIPGTKDKSLFDPGAEKLARRYDLVPEFEAVSEIEDFEKGFFFYKYKCKIFHGPTHTLVGEAIRICTSKEKKYSQYTKAEKWASEDEKKNAIGKKKNATYNTIDLILRKSPDEIMEMANTIISMAQKRAFVEAVRTATMTSSIFKGADVAADAVAPNKKVTREEDSHRNKLTMHLYGIAKDVGWSNKHIHVAIKKKWQKESLTEISSDQIEELIEFITTKYETVNPGEKPKLREEKVNTTPNSSNISDGNQEIPKQSEPRLTNKIDEAEEKKESVAVQAESSSPEYFCKGPRHEKGEEPRTTIDNPWCEKQCESDYWGAKPKSKLDALLEKGRVKKAEEERQVTNI